MPSTYTDNGLQKPGLGEQSGSWGTTANTNYDIVDIMAHGVVGVTLSGTTGTLTTSDGTVSDGAHKVIVFGGAPTGTCTVTVSPNDATHVYVIINNSGEDVVLTQGSGSNVTVPDGNSAIVYCDGSGSGANVVDITAQFGFIYSTAIGSTVQAYDADLTALGGLAKADGNFIVGDGSTWTVESGNAVLQSIGVTATATELNVMDGITATTAELNTLDGIPALGGNAGKAVVVNSSETALTLQAFPEGTVYTAGGGLTLTNNTIFSHSDTSTAAGINTFGAQVIDVLSLDTYGHVTTLSTRFISAGDIGAIDSVTAGSGLTGGGTSGAVTVSHADTSSQSSVNNSGTTVIQDVTLDTYGHVTGLGSTTLTLLGQGMSWSQVSRTVGTTYQNTRAYPIAVTFTAVLQKPDVAFLYVNSVNSFNDSNVVEQQYHDLDGGFFNVAHMALSAIIPPGHYYALGGDPAGIAYAAELK